MSLDVYLIEKEDKKEEEGKGSGVFVQTFEGIIQEISQAEWNKKFPGLTPIRLDLPDPEDNYMFHKNITHNLIEMAEEANLYYPLWRPEEISCFKAQDLIPYLRKGLDLLLSTPHYFRQFNPSNGWGTYEGLVTFVRSYLRACETYPETHVEVER